MLESKKNNPGERLARPLSPRNGESPQPPLLSFSLPLSALSQQLSLCDPGIGLPLHGSRLKNDG